MKKFRCLWFVILILLQLSSFNSFAQNCGSCSSPYSTLTNYANYAAADANYNVNPCNWPTPATGTIYTYHTINSGPSGHIGIDLSHESSSSTGCVGNTNRIVRLFLASSGACNWATGIVATLADGGNGATWSNPEFSGLTPNANYIVVVQTIIPSGCDVKNEFLTYYQITDPTGCTTCATASCPVSSVIASTVAAAQTSITTAISTFTDSYNVSIAPGQSQTICVQVTVPVGSTVLGFKQKATSSPSSCASASEEPVTYQLRPASNCAASPIPPSVTNASSVSSGFNPEWNDLAPGNYVLCYTMTISSSALCASITIDRLGYYNVIPSCTTPTITSQPASKIICSNDNTNFSVVATGATSYQWMVNTGTGWSLVSNGGVYSNATTANLNITGASSLTGAQYQCIVREATNSCSDTSSVALLTVNNALAPTYSKVSSNVTCAGPNTGSITFSGISPNTVFNWVSGPLISPIPTANKPAGATDERALINIPTGTYCVDITRTNAVTINQTLFSEEWETGGTNWTINNGGGNNIFVINNDYPGGQCVSGSGTFIVPAVPNQPVAVPGNPLSNYLHIKATTTTGATCGAGTSTPFPPFNANFDGVVSNQKVTLNTPIVTTGLSNVVFSFYWLGKGDGSGNDYGSIEYSINNGASWTQAGAKLFNKSTWFADSRTDPTWANQPSLLFRIKWTNDASSSTDPPISIDHIVVTGDASVSCDSTTHECFTISPAPSTVIPTFTQIPAFCQGTTAPTLPTTSTNSVTGTWNSTVSNITIGSTIYTFTPTTGQCALNATMSITVNPSITASIVGNTPLCGGQQLQLNAFPNSAVSYAWSGPNGYSLLSQNVVISSATSSNAGMYIVTVTGVGGCSGTASYNAVINLATPPTYSKTSTAVTCAGPNTGSITITPNMSSITYHWISGPVVSPIPVANKPTGAIDERALINLPAGTYCVDITKDTTAITSQALFTEEWETGGLNWTIDNSGGNNIFVINNDYPGGQCVSGAGTFTVPTVPNQPTAVPGNPLSNYLHIKATTTTGATCGAGTSTPFPPLNANFDGVVSNQKVTLNTPIVTTGLSNVVFSFYWLAKGDVSGNDYGSIEYSINGGTTWTQAGAKLFNQTTWLSDSRTDPSWSNQANLRFRIVWINNAASSTDPPLAIDHIGITGSVSSTCSSTINECITILPAPPNVTPTFTQIIPFCEGEPAPTLPTSSTNTPSYTGTWNATVNNVTPGTTTYTFTPTAGQCANSTTMDVTVKPIPVVGVTPNDTTVCLNSVIQLTASGANSYLWSPVSVVSSTTGATVLVTATNNRIIQVVGTTNGCSDSTTAALTVNQLPTITIQADPVNGCQPLEVDFMLNSNPVVQNATWNFGNGSTSAVNPASTIYPNAGSYNVSVNVIDVNGCTNSYVANNFITVYPTPNADFINTPDFAFENQEMNFTSTYTSSSATYGWNFGDASGFASGFSVNHYYSSANQYPVTHYITSPYGCRDSIVKMITVITDIKAPNVITPNGDGFNDKLVFDGLEGYSGVILKLYNRWGRGIYTNEDYRNDWDGGDFADGVYFYILTLPEKYKIKPFYGSMTILR
jgi:gliding motility-associated-like protein